MNPVCNQSRMLEREAVPEAGLDGAVDVAAGPHQEERIRVHGVEPEIAEWDVQLLGGVDDAEQRGIAVSDVGEFVGQQELVVPASARCCSCPRIPRCTCPQRPRRGCRQHRRPARRGSGSIVAPTGSKVLRLMNRVDSLNPKFNCGLLFQEMYVPSFGASLAAKMYSSGLFGWFVNTTRGLPGMWSLMNAAITRPCVSVPPPGEEFATMRTVLPRKYSAASKPGGRRRCRGRRRTGSGRRSRLRRRCTTVRLGRSWRRLLHHRIGRSWRRLFHHRISRGWRRARDAALASGPLRRKQPAQLSAQ